MSPMSPAPALRNAARGMSLAPLIAIVLAAVLASPGTASAANDIYWTNSATNTISQAGLDGSGGGDLVTGGTRSEPAGVAIDAAAGRIYWANRKVGVISYANLDGSAGGNLPIFGTAAIEHPSGIAIDPATGKLYWADSSLNEISFANLDGSGGGDLATVAATVDEPVGPAIDAAAGRIYWANLGDDTIAYASLGGSGGGDLATGAATVKDPAGVAIDPDASRVYWANAEAPAISYANPDGSGGGDLAAAGASFGGASMPALLEAPRGEATPEISGQHLIERPLFCSQGKWAPDLLGSHLYRAPTSFTYAWLRNGEAIAGEAESTYRPTKPGTYDCRVTAVNQAGSTAQTSADLALARGLAFANGFVPVHGRRALLTLRCVGDGRCRGLVKLIAHIGYSRVVHRDGHREVIRRRALFPIGKSSFSIFPGRTRVIHVKLKRKGKRLLHSRRGRRLGAKLLGRDIDHRRVLLKAGG